MARLININRFGRHPFPKTFHWYKSEVWKQFK